MDDSLFQSTRTLTDVEIENSLRPTTLKDYVGQQKIGRKCAEMIQREGQST